MTRLSRRRLLTSGAAASMLAATLPAQALPARGGVLRLAIPRRGAQAFQAAVAATTVFNRLTATDADGGLRGELATAWEASGDARDWSITLRSGVVFHDGSALTASDVAASLAELGTHLGTTCRVTADGPLRLRIRLADGDPGLPFLLADPALAISKSGIGTGPYAPMANGGLATWAPYFDDRRTGWFDRVEFIGADTPKDAAAAVRDGVADAADVADPAGLRVRRGRPSVSAISRSAALQISAQGAHAVTLANALRLGIDRPALLQTWVAGYGTVADDHAIAYDPDHARHQLERAGIDHATLSLSGDLLGCPATVRLLKGLSADGRAIGLALSLTTRDDPRPADLALSLAPPRMTREATLAAHPRGSLTDVPDFEARLAEARCAQSTAHRHDVLAALEHDVARHSTTVIPVHRDMTVVHTPRLTLMAEAGARSGPNVAERWFFG
ncbi:MAG: ABC transporter substrate-binding protein [Pseudomonadota bacterium]